jgi:hypothetical protein
MKSFTTRPSKIKFGIAIVQSETLNALNSSDEVESTRPTTDRELTTSSVGNIEAISWRIMDNYVPQSGPGFIQYD